MSRPKPAAPPATAAATAATAAGATRPVQRRAGRATGAEELRPYHHGDLRNALIAEGLTLLEEVGLAGLSLRAIAARAGVSHAAPRNHFGHLRGLLTAMAAEGFRRHVAFMRAGLPVPQDRPARLAAALRGYVRFAQAHPHLFALMFSSQHCDFQDPELGAAAAQSYDVLREIATDLDWDKADAPDAQRRAEMLLWSIVHGYAQLALAGQFRDDCADQALALPLVTDIVPAFGYRERAAPARGPARPAQAPGASPQAADRGSTGDGDAGPR